MAARRLLTRERVMAAGCAVFLAGILIAAVPAVFARHAASRAAGAQGEALGAESSKYFAWKARCEKVRWAAGAVVAAGFLITLVGRFLFQPKRPLKRPRKKSPINALADKYRDKTGED